MLNCISSSPEICQEKKKGGGGKQKTPQRGKPQS